MNGDMQLKQHVEDELAWEPSVNAAAIGVAVKDAIVTLSGHVANFIEKRAAERAVLRIRGVKALANELEVNFPADSSRSDEDIARAAASILVWNPSIPNNRVKVQISHGWITLEGDVDWQYQRVTAERAVEALMGVRGVTNQITVKPSPSNAQVKFQIEAALKRNAEIDARKIQVSIHGNRVTLSGSVNSMAERMAADKAAWRAQGVGWVENDITISPSNWTWNAA